MLKFAITLASSVFKKPELKANQLRPLPIIALPARSAPIRQWLGIEIASSMYLALAT